MLRFSKKKILVAAVAAFLGGMTGVSAASYTTVQQVKDGTTTYEDGSTIKVYNGTDAAGFKEDSGVSGIINVGNDGKGTIHISAESSDAGNSIADGIWVQPNANLTINGNVDISSVYSGSCFANGVTILNMGTGEGEISSITINGDLTIGDPSKQDSLTDKSTDKNWGVNAAELHGGYGPDGHVVGQADDYTGARWAPTGVNITCNGKGSTIDLNGNVYIAMRGTALKTDPYYTATGKSSYDLATINANSGDVTIFTPESTSESYHAAASYGGTININMNDDLTGGAGHKVTIQGNLLAMKDYNNMGQPYFFQDGCINMSLDTKDSSWIGVIDNSGKNQAGEVNLWLENGASWTHKSPSKTNGLQVQNMPSPSVNHYGKYDNVSHVATLHGGSSEANAGNLFTSSGAAIQIGNYDGYTNVYYSHTGNGEAAANYTAGDITIGNASAGSGISLITDNTGITMTDEDSVAKVLNALAGKLTYSAYATGERNLTGYAKIADGLTASSASLKTGNITFSDAGKGTYVKGSDPTPSPDPEPQPEVKTEFSTSITGVKETDTEYVNAGVLTDEGAHYKFTEDTTINVVKDSETDKAADVSGVTITKEIDHAVDINAEGHTLTINATSTGNKGNHYGVAANNFEGTTITADKLVINAISDKGRIEAFNVGGQGQQNADNANKLTVNGDIDMNVQGIGYTLGLYAAGNSEVTFNGNVTAMGDDEHEWGLYARDGAWGYYGCSLIYSGNNYTLQMGPKVTINGDIHAKIDGNGVMSNGGHAKISFNGGGYLEINKDNTHNYYALIAESATTSMNVNLDENYIATSARKNDLVLKGNVTASSGAINVNEPEEYSYVNLGLATKDSAWTGVAYNKFPDEGKTLTGKTYDGTDVTKTFYGAINVFLQNGATWNNEAWGAVEASAWGAEPFTGSHLAKLVGGESAANAGNIFQKDSNPLTIDNLSGYTNIYYAHEGNGEDVDNYTAGDTIVRKAAEGTEVSLITDNSGIDMDSVDSVDNALEALSQKLYYEAYTTGEQNLSGYVKIADGLTASSKAKVVGEIAFDDSTGQGYLNEDSVKPSEQITDSFTAAITGDKTVDQVYTRNGVRQTDGTYVFTKDSTTITPEQHMIVINKGWGGTPVNGSAAISGADADHSVTIDLKGHDLTVNTETSVTTTGITAIGDGVVEINNAGTMSVSADATGTAQAAALFVNLGGTVNIHNEGKLLTLRATGKNPANVAVIKTMNGVSGKMSSITVDGLVDVLADGTTANEALSAVASSIDVGGGTIKAVNGAAYAIRTYGEFVSSNRGRVNVNVLKDEEGNVTGAGNNKVELEGNIFIGGGMDAGGAKGDVNVGLNTADSYWKGDVSNKSGNALGIVTLYMGNEASWTGNNLSGNTVNAILDNATWTGYSTGKAMNLSLKNNSAWHVTGTSTIASLTGKNGDIFMGSDGAAVEMDHFSGTANIYYAHTGNGEAEENYTAGNTTVKTAESGSNISLITDNTGIAMDNDESVDKVLNALAGKLYYTGYTSGEENLSGQVKIADGLTASSVTKMLGNIVFDADTGKGSLDFDTTRAPEQTVETFSQVITGSKSEDKTYTRDGVRQMNGTYVFTVDPSKVSVEAESGVVNAEDNDITIISNDAALTLENTAEGGTGIYAGDGRAVSVTGKEINILADTAIESFGGTVTLDGDVIAKGTDAIVAEGENAKVSLSGGKADLTGDITVDGGSVEIKGADSSSDNGVTIKGDISVSDGGSVAIDLTGKNSTMEGGYQLTDGGVLTVNVKKGATWTLTDYTEKAVLYGLRNMVGNSSEALNLNGGASKDEAGNLAMKKTDDVTVSNYSGWMNVYYEHENKGQDTADYKAGQVVLGNVAENSGMILSTNDTLDTTEKGTKEAVEKVFTALAPKLQLSDAASQKDHLSGKIMRLYSAEGLTASSQEAEGQFTIDDNGYGQYVKDSVDIDGMSAGDYETYVMKGVRSAAATSFHAWRDNMQDTYRLADLADEDGIFAKVLGGKTKADVKGVHESNTYKGIQVGYDKALSGGWHAGVAFDYRDGDSDYLLGGDGDDKMYSFGVYGVKQLADNAYVRIAVKAGHVENEYNVYNEIRTTKLHGKYKASAYGVTAEYGKMFGKADAYLTPKLQFSYAHVGGKDYTASASKDTSLNVFQEGYDSFIGRAGLEAGMKKAKGSFYGALYLAHEFSGDINNRYYAKDGGWKSTSFDGEDTWVEFVIGADYAIGSNAQLYANFARDFGGDFEHQWEVNAGVRVRF